MAMKLLSFHYQFVADFSSHDEHDNLVSFDIIQCTQISCTQFKLGERIGSQLFDRFGRCRGLVLQAGQDGRFQNPLVTRRQDPELPTGFLCD
jgi:hypothetical protein